MPSHHRFVLNQDSGFFLREAAKVGPQTVAFVTAALRSRPFPQQAFRTCLGILDLVHKYLPAHLEIACQRLLAAHLLTYKDLKSELERLTRELPVQPLLTHEHVRGDTYYITEALPSVIGLAEVKTTEMDELFTFLQS